jgi:predicted esterase
MVFLHGAGGNMKLGLWTMYPFLAKERYVAVCPTYLDGQWWTPAGGKFLKKVLNDAQRKYAIDKTRVVVAGVSNGATGAWSVAKANSQEFWAIVSISGAFDGQESLLPTKGPPVYIAHGALDNVISVEFSRRAYKALARSRPNTAYKEYDDGGHLIFFTQRDDIMTSIFDWLRQLPAPASKGSR